MDDCMLWAGRVNSDGYGYMSLNSRSIAAHRAVYESELGELPRNVELDHLCRVRSCINPNHLEPVSHRENILRGNTIMAELAKRTHCKNGHEYTEENTYRYRGYRICRECQNVNYRKRTLRSSYEYK